jgi:hypothetical protein
MIAILGSREYEGVGDIVEELQARGERVEVLDWVAEMENSKDGGIDAWLLPVKPSELMRVLSAAGMLAARKRWRRVIEECSVLGVVAGDRAGAHWGMGVAFGLGRSTVAWLEQDMRVAPAWVACAACVSTRAAFVEALAGRGGHDVNEQGEE